MVEVDATLEGMDPHRARLLQLLSPAATVMDRNIGTALWCRPPRRTTLPHPCACQPSTTSPMQTYHPAEDDLVVIFDSIDLPSTIKPKCVRQLSP